MVSSRLNGAAAQWLRKQHLAVTRMTRHFPDRYSSTPLGVQFSVCAALPCGLLQAAWGGAFEHPLANLQLSRCSQAVYHASMGPQLNRCGNTGAVLEHVNAMIMIHYSLLHGFPLRRGAVERVSAAPLLREVLVGASLT